MGQPEFSIDELRTRAPRIEAALAEASRILTLSSPARRFFDVAVEGTDRSGARVREVWRVTINGSEDIATLMERRISPERRVDLLRGC